MNTENKLKWMAWVIAVLAVLNIATILTVVHNRNQADSRESTTADTGNQTQETSLRFSGRYFCDQLGFNSEQMSRFVEFNPVFRGNVRDINYQLNLLREQMLSEMASENYNPSRLEMLSDSIGYLHAKLKKMTYKYYLDIKKICDQQQQEKLEQLFSGMFVSDFRQGRNGNGNQHGKRHGRKFNN